MTEHNSEITRKGDRWVDAIAAAALLAIFVSAAIFWVSSQG